MLNTTHKFYIFLLLITFFVASCDFYQTDEANKLVGEANVLIEKHNIPFIQSNEIFLDIFKHNLTNITDIKDYIKKNESNFSKMDTLIKETETIGNQALDKYNQVSNLKLEEKYKEYTTIKTQEIKKFIELAKLRLEFTAEIQKVGKVDDWNKSISIYDEKIELLNKEIEDFDKKGQQIIKENPQIFGNKTTS